MKIEMTLTSVEVLSETCTALAFEGEGAIASEGSKVRYAHQAWFRVSPEDAKNFKVGETFTLERTK